MNRSAVSIMGWGLYCMGLGLVFLLIPNVLLPIFGFPTTTEVWIRVIGLLLLPIALYHIHCARNNVIPFFQITVPGRIGFGIGLVILFLMGFAGVGLVLFAIIEILGAAWTWSALRKQ